MRSRHIDALYAIVAESMRHIKVPVQFSKTPGGLRRHAERLGASSAEVLRELGYAPEQIDALVKSGVTLL